MAHSTVHVRLEYLLRNHVKINPDPEQNDFMISGFEEALSFTMPVAHVSAGAGNARPPGVTSSVDNILGLARVGDAEEPEGYLLYRRKGLAGFDPENSPERANIESVQLKLSWLDPSGQEPTFTTVYNIQPHHQRWENPVPDELDTLSWELLLKRTGDSPGNFRYFLRRIVRGEGGDRPFEDCDQLRRELEHTIQTQPDNKLAIRQARNRYKTNPCPPTQAD